MSLIFRRAFKMAAAAPKEPVVMIIGATGTGKSKVQIMMNTAGISLLIAIP